MKVRASTLLGRETVNALIHCMNGPTLRKIPIACTFASIMYHTLTGDSNGAAIIRWMRESGAADTKVNCILYGLGVFPGSLGVTDSRSVNAASVSASRGTSLLSSSNQA